jgi:hypothetical protein
MSVITPGFQLQSFLHWTMNKNVLLLWSHLKDRCRLNEKQEDWEPSHAISGYWSDSKLLQGHSQEPLVLRALSRP